MVAKVGVLRALALASWAAIVLATAYLFAVGVEVTTATEEAEGSPSVRTTHREPPHQIVMTYPLLATLAVALPSRLPWLRLAAGAVLVVWTALTIFSYGFFFGPLAAALFVASGVALLTDGKRSPPAAGKD